MGWMGNNKESRMRRERKKVKEGERGQRAGGARLKEIEGKLLTRSTGVVPNRRPSGLRCLCHVAVLRCNYWPFSLEQLQGALTLIQC